jgi:hypothetical protein
MLLGNSSCLYVESPRDLVASIGAIADISDRHEAGVKIPFELKNTAKIFYSCSNQILRKLRFGSFTLTKID